MTQEIQNKLAFVVIDNNTMECISKFYSRAGDAKGFITNRQRHYPDWQLAIAEFEYKTHYKIEEKV